MTNQSAQQARNTKIFVIISSRVNHSNAFVSQIYETTLYDHVMESAEHETSPRGVMTKMFIDEVDGSFLLRMWMNGKIHECDSFDTREEAEHEFFSRTYKYDFLQDDTRDTEYWLTREQADKELQNRKDRNQYRVQLVYSDTNDVHDIVLDEADLETAKDKFESTNHGMETDVQLINFVTGEVIETTA